MTDPTTPPAVVEAVTRALTSAPAFARLSRAAQNDLLGSLHHIGGYLGATPARVLADPDPTTDGSGTGGSGTGGSGPGGTIGRVGEAARATLNAIDFPSFVSALVKGTFQAIVDATIQQMEAYATLLQEVAKTVDDYMRDNVTEDAAKDYLVDRYPHVLYKQIDGGTPTLNVDTTNPTQQLPSFFRDLGFDYPAELDTTSLNGVVVPAARKTIAEQRHQTLATMVLLGLNRIVVNNGEINAKLQFHIDAAETTKITFNAKQTTQGNLAGVAGGSQFSGNGIMVNTTNVNTQSDINLRTDLTGEVRIQFASDVLPLERFADSNAIQLINQHATVPAVPPRTSDEETTGTDATASPAPAPVPETPAPGQVAAGQSVDGADPWSPRR